MIELPEAEGHAYDMHRADRNAQRSYSAAGPAKLRNWVLTANRTEHMQLDLWTYNRRLRLMVAELASRDAELCRSEEHYDRFGDALNEDIVAHVAAHVEAVNARLTRIKEARELQRQDLG